MSAKYTPGPWWIRGDLPGEPKVSFPVVKAWADATTSVTVCRVGNNNAYRGNDGHRDWNNARLIAAAPDLLEALIKYMDAIDMFDKASKDGINYHGAVGNRLATEEIARAAIAKATGKAQ